MAIPEPTQRAYTLRLCGTAQADAAWRDALWATHDAVNRGAKAFGDWLLTLRGGLDSALVDDAKTPQERRDRRVVLALSWLSVESHDGAPSQYWVASGTDDPSERAEKVIARFRQVLERRGLAPDQIESWLVDCRASLSARIRDDAVWINRSAAFDDAARRVGGDLTREEVWDLFVPFFGGPDAYFGGISAPDDDGEAETSEEKAKDLCQKARGWLSNRFGSGTGSDFSAVGNQYQAFADWCRWKHQAGPATARECRKRLCELLALDPPPPRLASTPGPPNRVQLAYQDIVAAVADGAAIPDLDYQALAEAATKLAEQKLGRTGRKAQRPWANQMLADVEHACGMTFRDTERNSDRINEFSVILDHAARRVSMNHSWQKRAESSRRKFEDDARKIATIPDEICALLSAFTARRSGETAAIEPYRIRRRAIDGWKEVVAEWSRTACKTADDRIAAARRLEGELNDANAKFGDIQLFEELAADAYRCVWESGGGADPQPLIDYVAAREAEWNQRRFKVPAYRHPDALRHPVFCDFGDSRWSIDFAAHRAPMMLAGAQAAVERKTAELRKAEAALAKAKTDAKRDAALARCTKAKAELSAAELELAWLSQRRGLRMKLFDGSTARDHELLWQSKRFTVDAALRQNASSDFHAPVDVSRADRLGRAVADADPAAPVNVAGLIGLKEWNGRLQVPRRELERIARITSRDDMDEGTAERIKKMRARLNWFVTFSARLQPSGPWLSFVESLPPGYRYDFKKKRLYCEANKGRKGRALLSLSRLPGLRLLSVDLGHRYAAACAVWQAITTQQMQTACAEVGHPFPRADELYVHLRRETGKLQKSGKRKGKPVIGTTVFRRIGPDALPNGTPHPAPWARLDRQFLVKLQGEERAARKASKQEIDDVERFEAAIGYSRQAQRCCAEKRVDELMSDALRTARLALKRHGRRARIANRLTAESVGGKTKNLDSKALIDSLVDTLADWHDLAFGKRWEDASARRLWEEHIRPMLDGAEPPPSDEDLAPAARRKQRENVEKTLWPVAEALSLQDRMKLRVAWANRWREDDTAWEAHLGWLKKWVAPKARKAGASARGVGGLSLTRIGNLRALYQLQKAHRMRPLPEDVRANIPEKGDDALRDFAKRSLAAMERLRDNRVKQLASRLVEAALGVGREPGRVARRDLKRARRRVDEPCHVVVIENLTHYRPEETRVRRENRQLMSWSAANVKKYLAEACELHGIHLVEVSPAFTSRQDSRTGAPGVRCVDVPLDEFVKNKRWQGELGRARERLSAGSKDARDLLLVQVGELLESALRPRRPARLPLRGGEVFVSADPTSPAAKGIQADLNAAANIGLKALLDPDWPGAWWNVPCDQKTYGPWPKSTSGSTVFDGVGALAPPPPDEKEKRAAGRRRGRVRAGDSDRPVYLWRDVSARPVLDGRWCGYQEYQNRVQYRVIQVLREQAGLEGASPVDDPEDVPF